MGIADVGVEELKGAQLRAGVSKRDQNRQSEGQQGQGGELVHRPIREKLADADRRAASYLETVWGRGYALRDPENEPVLKLPS